MAKGGDMRMQNFEVTRPGSLDQALLEIEDSSGVPLAGGTDLMVRIKNKLLSPKKIVDLSGINELAAIEEAGDYIVMGAMATHQQVVESPITSKYLPLLAQGCAAVGSPQIRNAGTLGGNIMNASPAADSIPPLVALGARVILNSAAGKREMVLENFITGPGRTQILPGELLTGVVVKKMRPGERFKYKKLGQRKALAISIAGCAVKMEYDPAAGKCSNPSIAFGSVSPVVKRSSELERLLAASKLDDRGIQEIAARAREFCSPISDIRASAEYRREMCASLLFEVLSELIN